MEQTPRVDRTVLVVQSLHDAPEDRRYWWSRSPAERVAAVEAMRRVIYGEAAIGGRVERVMEIARRPSR